MKSSIVLLVLLSVPCVADIVRDHTPPGAVLELARQAGQARRLLSQDRYYKYYFDPYYNDVVIVSVIPYDRRMQRSDQINQDKMLEKLYELEQQKQLQQLRIEQAKIYAEAKLREKEEDKKRREQQRDEERKKHDDHMDSRKARKENAKESQAEYIRQQTADPNQAQNGSSDLEEVVAAWPKLSPELRQTIVKMVR